MLVIDRVETLHRRRQAALLGSPSGQEIPDLHGLGCV
jgi:hypothetical protein